MSSHTLNHPTLNSALTGISVLNGRIHQYRNLKFASVPARFARARLMETYPSQLDCTQFGPVAPQIPLGNLFAIPVDQIVLPKLKLDEFECLNLNVTVPAQRAEGLLLPVFVFIYGGANKAGTANIPLYDLPTITLRSVTTNRPMICVSINYRVSIFGFGCLCDGTGINNGIYDQRLALQWVQRHIRGFGGDPSRVTVCGESAGSTSIDFHLYAKDSENKPELQLFRRAVLMSGTMMANQPRPKVAVTALTKRYADNLSGDGTWEEKLRTASVKELLRILATLGEAKWPYVGEGWYDEPLKLYQVVPSWCEAILIGDCEYESMIYAIQVASTPAISLISALQSLGAPGKKLITAYSITGDNLYTGLLRFISDGVFIFPNECTVGAWRQKGKPVFRYLFEQRNPWHPDALGAHHAVDLLYLFRTFKFPDEGSEKVGLQVQDDFINFTTAEGGVVNLETQMGWDGLGEKVRTFGGPDGTIGFTDKGEFGQKRRVDIFEGVLKEIGIEMVAKAIGTILGVLTTVKLEAHTAPLGKL